MHFLVFQSSSTFEKAVLKLYIHFLLLFSFLFGNNIFNNNNNIFYQISPEFQHAWSHYPYILHICSQQNTSKSNYHKNITTNHLYKGIFLINTISEEYNFMQTFTLNMQ